MSGTPGKRFGNVLLCDDIRIEMTRKYILVGVYSGNIMVRSFPARIVLATYIEYIPEADGDSTIEVNFYIGRKQFARAAINVENAVAGDVSPIVLPRAPFPIEKESVINISASVNGAKPRTIISKRVIQGELAQVR